MREEKMEQQRIHQEERVKRALERAKADPKKKVKWRRSLFKKFQIAFVTQCAVNDPICVVFHQHSFIEFKAMMHCEHKFERYSIAMWHHNKLMAW